MTRLALSTLAVPLLFAAATALAAPQRSDARIAEDVAARLQRYVFYTIFDDAEIRVENGVVTLTGCVTMPYKAEALEALAARVEGVVEVVNRIRTLPVSIMDDEIRYRIARGIYEDPLFAHYALQPNPPVHIVVERGHVTLTGVVFSEVERRKAEVIANSTFPAMSVTSRLRVELGD
jgi:osmotically-inducible protein OsmY